MQIVSFNVFLYPFARSFVRSFDHIIAQASLELLILLHACSYCICPLGHLMNSFSGLDYLRNAFYTTTGSCRPSRCCSRAANVVVKVVDAAGREPPEIVSVARSGRVKTSRHDVIVIWAANICDSIMLCT